MDSVQKEIMKFWNKDQLVSTDPNLLNRYDLSEETTIILSAVGLPKNAGALQESPFYIHFYHEPKLYLDSDGEQFILLADSEESKVGIDLQTNHLYLLDSPIVEKRFINTNLLRFLIFLSIYLNFRPRLIHALENDDEDQLLAIIDNMKAQLQQVDAKALEEEESYWSVILEQVEDGISC